MNENIRNRWIFIISISVPLFVAVLFFTPSVHLQIDVSFLPKLNAIINSLVSLFLVLGFWFIKHKNRRMHKISMLSAFSLSALFLISYLVYHSAADSTIFGDINHDGVADAAEKSEAGAIRYLYYFLLLTHILLAAVILPFILITISRALSSRFDKHKKIARITFPLWLYVSVSGVLVYLLIAPYYS